MKVLHITPATIGYEEVTLVANAIDHHNNMVAIEKDGQMFMTGGFIINDTPEIREVLNKIPTDKQYEFVKSFKMQPYVAKMYFNP